MNTETDRRERHPDCPVAADLHVGMVLELIYESNDWRNEQSKQLISILSDCFIVEGLQYVLAACGGDFEGRFSDGQSKTPEFRKVYPIWGDHQLGLIPIRQIWLFELGIVPDSDGIYSPRYHCRKISIP
jgi:hypothetical protein